MYLRMALMCLAVTALGCGETPTATVTGNVTYQGRLVLVGSVLMEGEGSHAQAEIQPDGSYFFEGIKQGTVRIAVFSSEPGTPCEGADRTSRLVRPRPPSMPQCGFQYPKSTTAWINQP